MTLTTNIVPGFTYPPYLVSSNSPFREVPSILFLREANVLGLTTDNPFAQYR